MIPKRLLSLLLLALLVFPAYLGISAGGNRYKVAACDWMMLKRQKLGSFKLMHELGGDGVEMDMGGLGVRDTFDNKFHHRHFRKLFRETADSLGVLVPSVAMSGFYGQSFLTHHNYKALVEDCLSTNARHGLKSSLPAARRDKGGLDKARSGPRRTGETSPRGRSYG